MPIILGKELAIQMVKLSEINKIEVTQLMSSLMEDFMDYAKTSDLFDLSNILKYSPDIHELLPKEQISILYEKLNTEYLKRVART